MPTLRKHYREHSDEGTANRRATRYITAQHQVYIRLMKTSSSQSKRRGHYYDSIRETNGLYNLQPEYTLRD